MSSWAIENYMWLHASGTICHSVSDGLSPREVAPGEVADLSRYIGNCIPLKGTVEKINLVLEYLSCQHELPPGFSIGDLLRTCGVPVSPMRSFVPVYHRCAGDVQEGGVLRLFDRGGVPLAKRCERCHRSVSSSSWSG